MRYLLPLLLIGCAPLTEDEQFQRWYDDRFEYEQYLERKAACLGAGYIWVTQFEEKPNKVPRRFEMRTAYCTARLY